MRLNGNAFLYFNIFGTQHLFIQWKFKRFMHITDIASSRNKIITSHSNRRMFSFSK